MKKIIGILVFTITFFNLYAAPEDLSKDDYKFNLIVMYKLVKKINSKQDIKDLKDKIEYRYAVLMNNDIAGFVE